MAVKKRTGRWSGTKRSGADQGKKTAAADRRLQREAEARRPKAKHGPKKAERTAQLGAREHPEPPLPKQQQPSSYRPYLAMIPCSLATVRGSLMQTRRSRSAALHSAC